MLAAAASSVETRARKISKASNFGAAEKRIFQIFSRPASPFRPEREFTAETLRLLAGRLRLFGPKCRAVELSADREVQRRGPIEFLEQQEQRTKEAAREGTFSMIGS